MNRKFSDAFATIPESAGLDEREERIVFEGVARAFSVGIYATMLAAVIMALTGAGLWSGVVIFAAGVPSMALMAYCNKHGVDYNRIYYTKPSTMTIQTIVSLVFIAAWLGAIVSHVNTGHPVIDVPGVAVGGDNSGLIGGAAIGVAACMIAMWTQAQRRAKAAQRDDDPAAIPDED